MIDAERIAKVKEFTGLSYNRLASEIGLATPQILYDIKNGKIGISKKVAELISAKYLNIRRSWLLTGEGDMLRSPEAVAIKVETPAPVAVRFFEVTPTATFQEFCTGMSEAPETTKVIPSSDIPLDDSFCVFEISGESMAPQIQDHARVLCQEIPPSRWHQLPPCVVVIAYADRFVIKRITANHLADLNFVDLASDNPDYPATERVQLADIRAIFRAKRIISSDIN